MRKYFLILSLAIVLAACSGVKGLSSPDGYVPGSFVAEAEVDSVCVADLRWWEFYSDSTLCAFIRTTLDNNKDLLTAASRIEELRHLYGAEKANMLPDISANIYANRETNDYSGAGTTYDSELGLKATVAWEVNLLGSLAWAKKRAGSLYKASVEDYRAMQISLIAMTAETYYRMAALENELQIVMRTVETRKESVRMAKIRFEGGLTSETVYQQAMVEYATAAAKLPDLRRRLTETRNSLTLLMGETPKDSMYVGGQQLAPINVAKLPVGIPAALLKRRPDLRASELKLASAMANVGYTYADRFPTFRVGLTPGFENDELRKFLESPFSYVIGSLTGPVFDFGRRKRKYEAAVAVYEQNKYQYEKAVIQAFTEVNTAISAYCDARESMILKNELCLATAKYIQLAQLQYRAGTLNYIDVLDAQRRYFEAQIDLNNVILDEYLALINLYKVLGGGWQLNDQHIADQRVPEAPTDN